MKLFQKVLSKRLYPALVKYMESFPAQFKFIPENRKRDLERVADFISTRIENEVPARIIFICTHNSRRSHMGQIWAAVAAYYYGKLNMETYSGGTEATAFNPKAVEAMRQAGFKISSLGTGKNPVYSVQFAEDYQAIKVFSKKFDDSVNPTKDFCAVVTCSDADKNCPYIPGAILRVPITYEDPKLFDHTEKESEAYRERCLQIGAEMFYLFGHVKKE
jgi:protein-tyrosine-phosphatase